MQAEYTDAVSALGTGFCKVRTTYHSPGIWSLEAAKSFLGYALPRLQLQLAVIFVLTQCLELLFRPLKFQRVVAEILAGLILGPSIAGKIIPNFSQTLFPMEGDIFIDSLSKIGFIFFMFIAGVQMQLSIVKTSGRKAWTIGIGSVLIPIVVGTCMSLVVDHILPLYYRPAAKAIIGVQTLTPFAVVACLLIDLEIVNSELGRLALASTLISDVISSVFTTGIRFAFVGWSSATTLQSLILSLCSILVMLSIARPLFIWIIKQTPEGKPVEGVYIVVVSLIVIISAVVGDLVGLQYQFCPLILGLAVPSGPPLGTTLIERLEAVLSGLFAPLIVSSCGLKFDAFRLYDLVFLRTVWIIFALTSGLKAFSVILSALLCKMPIRDATVLSIIMSAQGIIELALYQNYFMNQTIDEETFASATFSVLVTDIITTWLIRSLYDYSRKYTGYHNRDIQHLSPNTQLRILACTNRQDDALSAIKLLEMSNATKGSPIAVYALQLVELIGQASPLLINHDFGQKASSILGLRSTKVIDIFRHYEQQHPEVISVQAFTGMSLPRFMHEDIGSLAFDKLVSIIILPFHRKWNQQGRLVSDSSVVRATNRNVLETAPCSVGILVDRHKIWPSSQVPSVYRIAVIFVGGDDDREGLSYGLRMAGSPGTHLSVIRLMAPDDIGEDEWETVLNIESLKKIKILASIHANVVYKEEMTTDGSETAGIMNQAAEVFDFIILGRRHRDDSRPLSGLMEWCEVPEIGPLADILTSTDSMHTVSVLVVQRQKNRTEDRVRRQTSILRKRR